MGRITLVGCEIAGAAVLIRLVGSAFFGLPPVDPSFQAGLIVGAGLVLAHNGRS
jgi:hypothetical protein